MTEIELVKLVPHALSIRSVKLVMGVDNESYGFIDFHSNEAAVEAMQYIKSNNCQQYVNFAYESEKDPLNVYVTNIPESWNSDNVENLRKIFSPYGEIASALVMTRRSTNTCTGTGFVRYLSSEDAQRAISEIRKANITLKGAKRPLELKLADRQRTRETNGETNNINSVIKTNSSTSSETTSKCHSEVDQRTLSLPGYHTECLNNQFDNNSVPSMKPHLMPIMSADFSANCQGMTAYSTSSFQTAVNTFPYPTYGLFLPEPETDPRELRTYAPFIPMTGSSHFNNHLTCIPCIPQQFVDARFEDFYIEKLINDITSTAFGFNINNQATNFEQVLMNTMSPYFKPINEFFFHCATAGILTPTQPIWNKACFHG